MTTEVVILGAGFAGLELSTRLSESAEDIHTTVIDRNDSFVFGFSKFEVLFGHKTVDEVALPYRDFVHDGVEFRQEVVTLIDPEARRVETYDASYQPDVLVVALGADLDPGATPGLVEGGYEFYSVPGTERARDAIAAFDGGEVVIAVLGVPFKCPPSPYEAAFLLHEHLTARGLGDKSSIRVITPMPSPIPVSMETSASMLEGLSERGIAYMPSTKVTSLDPGAKEAKLSDGGTVGYDLFLGVPVHRVPAVVEACGLTEGGTDGWAAVDKANLMTRFPGVYAVGDNADAPVPRAGTFAESAAVVVTDDIIAGIRGERSRSRYEGTGVCYIEFGAGRVGKVDADFLGGATPVATFSGPSSEFAGEKADFAATRRKRWFGL